MKNTVLILLCYALFCHAGTALGENASASDLAKYFPVEGSDKVMQFLIDPLNPEQGWMLTEDFVEFNPGLKSDGKWQIKFSKDTFKSVTGFEAGNKYRHRKMQTSKSKAGVLYLLVEDASTAGDKKLYLFQTTDYGDTWQRVKKGKNDTATPVAESSGGKRKPSQDEAVDLKNMGDVSRTPITSGEAHHHGGGAQPMFRVLFDLLLDLRPGISPLTFDSYHNLLMVDFTPRPELTFSFEVSPSPRYYELDYQINPHLTLRAGRIWIPFDQVNPHNYFGGRVNTTFTQPPGAPAFLPDLWTDLGLGLKYQLIDTKELEVEGHVYVTNGFQAGGTDPLGVVGNNYPNFSGVPNIDNNTDKAVGVRLHALAANVFGIGASVYESRYTNDGQPDRRVVMVGADAQLRLNSGFEAGLGYIFMKVGLPPPSAQDSFLRGGFYGEIGQKFASRFKLMARAGTAQNDNRLIAVTDQSLVGLVLEYDLGLAKISAQYYKDLQVIAGKTNYEYSALRAMILF
jgi:hypothetical protein